MMFRLTKEKWRRAAPLLLVAAGLFAAPAAADDLAAPFAVVPTQVIYPGQSLDPSRLKEVRVTNPNIRADYVHRISALAGMVATRTLLPGRVIPPSSVREPFAVEQGKPVQLVYSHGGLTITTSGMPLQNAIIGDVVRVRNIESGITVTGTVTADRTVEVAAQ